MTGRRREADVVRCRAAHVRTRCPQHPEQWVTARLEWVGTAADERTAAEIPGPCEACDDARAATRDGAPND